MADEKLSQKTQATAVAATDLMLITTGMGGTPLTQYINPDDLIVGLMALGQTLSTGNGNVRSFTATIADDAATSFTPSATIGLLIIGTVGTGRGGIVIYSTTSPLTGIVVGGADLAVTTGALAGTTGTDTKLTVSAHSTDGKIYVENRTGASRAVYVLLI